MEISKIHSAVFSLIRIHYLMKPRLDAHKQYKQNYPNRNIMYCLNGLAPNEVVNQLLNELVNICNEKYSPDEIKRIEIEINNLRQDFEDISNFSEAEMERVSLNYIFHVFDNNTLIYSQKKKKTLKKKLKGLQNIIFNYPKKSLIRSIPSFDQFVFPYLENYKIMAQNELRLLTFGDSIPNLLNKRITFVGAGFPLSAIFYHFYSHAKILLIDIDNAACRRAEKFLEICHNFGILNKHDFEILHSNATNLKYNKFETKDIIQQCDNFQSDAYSHQKNIIEVKTDILVLAAALSGEVKARALENVSSNKIIVINRCTSEMNNFLYPSTKLSALKKKYNLGKKDERDYQSVCVLYPEFAYQNKVINGNNKKNVPAFKTDKINQNTTQRVTIRAHTCELGV